ncbi:MAG: diguanylate cyclase [Halieaceae bacterium]|jgi:diguanylate cyclase (GGDEF)-like protein|nr:diguanylate cyclase [Halieaceae bacterium]
MSVSAARNLVLAVWLLVIGASAYINYSSVQAHIFENAFQAAEGFFKQIVVTRHWNAGLGGVYAPVSDKVRPNEYLDVPERDIPGPNGSTLTKINPAYMTRLLSELAVAEEGVRFRITSLDPVRPENAPTLLESRYLGAFERDPVADAEYVGAGENRVLFYMAPLITEEDCLQCHEDQGYHVGDVRGGVSVEIPVGAAGGVAAVALSHSGLFLFGTIGIVTLFNRLGRYVDTIEYQASFDSLSALKNRRTIEADGEREFRRSTRLATALVAMMIDIDHFKAINDSYGHQAGDECIRALADCLRSCFARASDCVARVGGEEFLVLLPDTGIEVSEQLAVRLRSAVARIECGTGRGQCPQSFTVSVGIAMRLPSDDQYSDLIKRADEALYRAKEQGRDRIVVA